MTDQTRRLIGDDNTCRCCEGDGLGFGEACRECRGTGLHWPEGIALGCRRQLTGDDLEIIRLAAWGLYDDIKAGVTCDKHGPVEALGIVRDMHVAQMPGHVFQWASETPSPEVGMTDFVFAELRRATAKFPTWPTDPLHALAVLGEEYGELTKAMLQHTYEPHKSTRDDVRTEAIQTAAMALRLAMSLDRYEYRHCEQHEQAPLAAAKEQSK